MNVCLSAGCHRRNEVAPTKLLIESVDIIANLKILMNDYTLILERFPFDILSEMLSI